MNASAFMDVICSCIGKCFNQFDVMDASIMHVYSNTEGIDPHYIENHMQFPTPRVNEYEAPSLKPRTRFLSS